MITAIHAVVALSIVGVLAFVVWTGARTYRRLRGKMMVTCPETNRVAGVSVDARRATLTGLAGHSVLRLSACTRWPERKGCDQGCLSQIERSPGSCLVRTMLTDWYGKRSCVLCGADFPRVDSYDHEAVWWYDQKPAFRSPDGRTVEWRDIAVDALPEVLETHRPLCWDCLIADKLCRTHPELITPRPAFRRRGATR